MPISKMIDRLKDDQILTIRQVVVKMNRLDRSKLSDIKLIVLSELEAILCGRETGRKLTSNQKKRIKKVLNEHKKKYYKYLDSAAWRNKREELFAVRGKKCETCGSIHQIEVHHKHYKNIFKEKLEDLVVLCRNCHRKIHGKPHKP